MVTQGWDRPSVFVVRGWDRPSVFVVCRARGIGAPGIDRRQKPMVCPTGRFHLFSATASAGMSLTSALACPLSPGAGFGVILGDLRRPPAEQSQVARRTGCGTKPICGRFQLPVWQWPAESLWGWDLISNLFLFPAGFGGLAGAVGTGSFLLTRRRTSHYGRLTNVAPRMNPTLQPPRGIGRRTWSRNELLLGERAAFFRFQSSRGIGRAIGTGGASA